MLPHLLRSHLHWGLIGIVAESDEGLLGKVLLLEKRKGLKFGVIQALHYNPVIKYRR